MGRPSNAEIAARADREKTPSITYTPIHPGDPADTLWNRHRFRANIPVAPQDVKGGLSAIEMVELAKSNPWFAVEGEEQARATPIVPETPEQYRSYAVAWIRLSTSTKEMSSRWRSEDDMRVQCGVGDDDIEYIQGIYRPRLAILKEQEALQLSAVNE
jgi:hypothetical protein